MVMYSYHFIYVLLAAKPTDAPASTAAAATAVFPRKEPMRGKTVSASAAAAAAAQDNDDSETESEEDDEDASDTKSAEESPPRKPKSKVPLSIVARSDAFTRANLKKKKKRKRKQRKSRKVDETTPTTKNPPPKKRKTIKTTEDEQGERTVAKKASKSKKKEQVDVAAPVPVANFIKKMSEVTVQDTFGSKSLKDFAVSQRTYEAAKPAVFKMAGLPFGKEEEKAWNKSINVKKKKETAAEKKERVKMQKEDLERFKKLAGLEAHLHTFNSVKALQYVPPDKDNMYMGSFNVMLHQDDKVVEVSRQWVRDNFEEDVINSVMVKFVEDFVDVADDVEVLMDERQIQKLRYIPAIPRRTTDEEDQPEHFQGVLSDESTVTLTPAYVRKTFQPGYVEHVIHEATNDNQRFFLFQLVHQGPWMVT